MARGRRKGTEETGELTPLELELMQIIWERGDATGSEVVEALRPARVLAQTTVHTVLANLRKKGFVEPVPTIERATRFRATVERDQIATRSMRRMIADFFGGSPKHLLVHLMKEEEIDEAELREIRKMLKDSPKEGGKRK